MSTASLPADSDARRVAYLQWCLAVFALLLVGATWPLWSPTGDYPVIPWFGSLLGIPIGVDRVLAWGMLLSGVGVAVWSARQCLPEAVGGYVSYVPESIAADGHVGNVPHNRALTFSGLIWLSCLTGSVLLDQQRFQVWAWEFFWLTMFLIVASPKVALRCCRILVIGIYTYSAISKFDVGFIEAQGPWLWQGLRHAVGVGSTSWESTSTLWMLAFPTGELLVAGLLLDHRTRRWGVAASWVMHLTLLLTLGPLGWNQKPGVLLWNVFFLLSVPLLFVRTDHLVPVDKDRKGPPALGLSRGDRFCLAAVLALTLWPALEGFGLCDHWPAWAVYSSRPEIVTIEVPDDQVRLLPSSLQPHIGPPQPLSNWRPVSIDQWSFQQRHTPVYAQARYRLAVANHIVANFKVQLRVVEQSSPNRWSGQRTTTEIPRLAASNDQRFWFNTASREMRMPIPVTFGDRMIALTAQFSVGCYAIAWLLSSRRSAIPVEVYGTDLGVRSPGPALTLHVPSRTVAAFWSAGLVGLTIHFACAFQFLHHWSHSAALKHTALRTFEVTGWDWPGGLYINYAFLLFWAFDAARLWREALGWAPVASLRWRRFVQGVFLFMMFNATVVFGPWHWTVASVAFVVAWWMIRQAQCWPLRGVPSVVNDTTPPPADGPPE